MLKPALFLPQEEGVCYTSCMPCVMATVLSPTQCSIRSRSPSTALKETSFVGFLAESIDRAVLLGSVKPVMHKKHILKGPRTGDKNTKSKKNEKQNSQIIHTQSTTSTQLIQPPN